MNPADFQWEEKDIPEEFGPVTVPSLRYSPSGNASQYFFIFGEEGATASGVTYSPGDRHLHHTENNKAGFVGQLVALGHWLENVKRETAAPDLWATLEEGDQLLETASVPGGDNSKFSAEELKRIRLSIEELRKYVFETELLNESRHAYVSSRLDYLIEASERLGRKDFLNIAVSVVMQVVVDYAPYSMAAAQEFWRMASHAFNWIVNAGPHLLT
jgi:hypothetical protein